MDTSFIMGEFPMDANSSGVIVIPVNLQGITDLDVIGRRFETEFPNVHKAYKKDCYVGEVFAGDCKLYEEGKFKVALMYYKNFVLGEHAEREGYDRQALQFGQCLGKLLRLTESDAPVNFYSPPIPFPECQITIKTRARPGKWVTIKEG